MVLANWLVGMLVTVGLTFFYAIIGLGIVLARYFGRRRNPLDIVILKLTNDGVSSVFRRGRQEHYKGRGLRTVTGRGLMLSKVRENLGYNITDDDMTHSGMGVNRKFLIVVMKDGLTSSLKKALVSDEFSDAEKVLLSKCDEEFSNAGAVRLTDIPKTLSLTPILSEQTRFRMDVEQDVLKIDGNDDRKMARRMLFVSAGIFFFTLIICLVLFVVMLNQGPDLAASVAARSAVNTVPSIAPGITLPG